jgi:hypothetical protein
MKKISLSILGLVLIASTSCNKIDCKEKKRFEKIHL